MLAVMRCSLVLSLSLVVGLACGGAPSAPTPEAAPAEAEKQVDDADEERPEREGRNNVRRLARAEREAVAKAYAEGSLGDKLATDGMLLIDAKVPPGTDSARYYLMPGPFTAPAKTNAELQAQARADRKSGQRTQRQLASGLDADRPAVFREVPAGTYTACASVSGVMSAEKKAWLEKAKAAVGDGKPDAKKVTEALAKAEAETGFRPERVDWDALPVRCKQVEVTVEAASRVVLLPPV